FDVRVAAGAGCDGILQETALRALDGARQPAPGGPPTLQRTGGVDLLLPFLAPVGLMCSAFRFDRREEEVPRLEPTQLLRPLVERQNDLPGVGVERDDSFPILGRAAPH